MVRRRRMTKKDAAEKDVTTKNTVRKFDDEK
jgi:hypothetical protein